MARYSVVCHEGHNHDNERLKALKLYSVQRRERYSYCIIYVWTVLEGLVPNFPPNLITATLSDRRGRSCTISNANVGRKGTLAFNSFRWRSIRMFNGLPKYLRNITLCSVNTSKTQLATGQPPDQHTRPTNSTRKQQQPGPWQLRSTMDTA